MAKLPAFAKAFVGRWRIVEMDVWDKDFLDLVETAHLTFKGAADGEIAFGALKSFLDVRYGTATVRRARSSRGREMMRTTRPPVVDGLSLALQAASSDTSTSTTATIQASYAIVPDFFNGLLEEQKTPAQSSPKMRFGKSAGSERLAIPLTRLRSSSASAAPPFATSPLAANGGGWLIEGAQSKRSDFWSPASVVISFTTQRARTCSASLIAAAT